MSIEERAEEALRDWAAPNEELGWGGSTEVAEHAHEIVGWLSDQALLRLDDNARLTETLDRVLAVANEWVPSADLQAALDGPAPADPDEPYPGFTQERYGNWTVDPGERAGDER